MDDGKFVKLTEKPSVGDEVYMYVWWGPNSLSKVRVVATLKGHDRIVAIYTHTDGEEFCVEPRLAECYAPIKTEKRWLITWYRVMDAQIQQVLYNDRAKAAQLVEKLKAEACVRPETVCVNEVEIYV